MERKGSVLQTNNETMMNNHKVYDYSQVKDLSLMIDSTNKCQLQCSYCYYGEKGCAMMNPNLLIKSITNFVEAIGPQVRHVNLHYMGGEPLIGWKEIQNLNKDFRAYSEQKGIAFDWSLTSNLVALDRRKMEVMIKEKANIHCSIDGPQIIQDKNRPFHSGKGSFKVVDKHINHALKITPDDTARVTVTPYSTYFLPDITSYILDKGFNCVGLFPAYNMDWTEKDLEAWSKGIKESFEIAKQKGKEVSTIVRPGIKREVKERNFTYCGAGKGLWSFNVNGNLYACHHFSNFEEHAIINASTATVEMVRKAINAYKVTPISLSLPESCQSCPANHLCNGGCWSDNFLNTGNPFTPEAISCTFNQITYDSLRDYLEIQPLPEESIRAYCRPKFEDKETCYKKCEDSCQKCDRRCQWCDSSCDYCQNREESSWEDR